MLWKGRRESDNVEDRRRVGGKTLGGGTLILGAFVYYLMGGNPLVFLAQNINQMQPAAPITASSDERKRFVSVVLADTEDVWSAQFRGAHKTYRAPKLVLFRNLVDSGCGRAGKSTGPFYCPLDQRVYLDLDFLDELSRGLGAKGEFAGAYVIAHEIGHHVQTLLGLERGAQRTNAESVRIELQADCLAGVWTKQTEKTKNVIEARDIEEALGAASAVGDDRLQKRARGYVVPDSFTHGSSADRMAAFQRGYRGAELAACL